MLMPLLMAAALTMGQDPSNPPSTPTLAPKSVASAPPGATIVFDGAAAPPQDTGSSGPEATATPQAPEAATGTNSPTGGAYSLGQRRALQPAFDSPPFPSGEYQGYPLLGIPPDTTRYPLMKELQGTWFGDLLDSQRIRMYGWLNASVNYSTSKDTNTPDSYWIVPNHIELDQAIVRVERQLDTAQTDHIDWGFRSTLLFGIDYRYMTSGGWFSDQLLEHNLLYGYDPTEQYIDVYFPNVAQGMIVQVGRWIATPDIETQFGPDNYLVSHSILFTFDTYTQTGIMFTFMLNKQWSVQAALHSGTDMAPWYKGATPTGMFGVRWVSESNNDSVYTVLNSINDARFRIFEQYGQPMGHDNFNYVVTTWQHRFNPGFQTRTEAYFMWQLDGPLGGTPSAGPAEEFGGGGGIGPIIPGVSLAYGVLNYTMFEVSHKDFITIRNEWWKDEKGERSGFPGVYTSHTLGLTHNFTDYLQVRPEIGYFRNWTNPAFDLGRRHGELIVGADVTVRF